MNLFSRIRRSIESSSHGVPVAAILQDSTVAACASMWV